MKSINKKFGVMFSFVAIMIVGLFAGITNVSGAITYTEASVANVADGSYGVARDLNLYTDGTPAPNSLAYDFIQFVYSETGQNIVAGEDYVPLAESEWNDTYSYNGATGEITIEGSTTVLPIIQTAKENYTTQHSDVTINVQGTGSGNGIEELQKGNVDIAMASRKMKDSEAEDVNDPMEWVIAKDGIAIVVNEANEDIINLTTTEVMLIYRGIITNWAQLGGKDAEIAVCNREEGSGTRDYFHEAVVNEDAPFRNDDAITAYASNGAVKTAISGNADAIGYVGLGYVEGLKVVNVAVSDLTPHYEQYEGSAGIDGFNLLPVITAFGIVAAIMIYRKKRV